MMSAAPLGREPVAIERGEFEDEFGAGIL
jgi:hypothetical protein